MNFSRNNYLDKLGFTLIELIAVIIILAIVALIATPIILNVIDDSKISVNQSKIALFANDVKLKYEEEKFNDIISIIDDEWISNINNNITCDFVYYSLETNTVLNKCRIKDDKKEYCLINGKFYDCNDSDYLNLLNDINQKIFYSDNSGANKPELFDNMISIKYDGTNWRYSYNFEPWYNYSKQKWANAVFLKEGISKKPGDIIEESDIALWYVWIPRYKYKIFDASKESKIDIIFEKESETTGTVSCKNDKCVDVNGDITNDISTYTHPAFTFNDKEINGLWVSKFEVTGSTSLVNASANSEILKDAKISNLFNAIHNSQKIYNINGNVHMIKNMEWGAITYFTNSKYGVCNDECKKIENNSSLLTGGGNYKDNVNQSSTLNIYGIYDLNGGTSEYVMANILKNNNNFNVGQTGFISIPQNYYYDQYAYNENDNNYLLGKLGDATKEIMKNNSADGAWYDGIAQFPTSNNPWFIRGNSNDKGIFSYSYTNGNENNHGTRSILVNSDVEYIVGDNLPLEPIILDTSNNRYHTVSNNKNKVSFSSENWNEKEIVLNYSKNFGIIIGEKTTEYKIKFKNNTGVSFTNGKIDTEIVTNDLGYLKSTSGSLSKNTVAPNEEVEVILNVKNNFLTEAGNQTAKATISFEVDGKTRYLNFIVNYN